jgi:hypothetical protein
MTFKTTRVVKRARDRFTCEQCEMIEPWCTTTPPPRIHLSSSIQSELLNDETRATKDRR